MSRTIRHQMPGAAFHIAARTQGCEPWFEEHGLQRRVCEIIDRCVTTSDATLLARTVMPNHVHIVLRQGPRPLAYSLQPTVRRIALLVQRVRDVRGHVFERPFRSSVCGDATYLRRSVAYTHLNPVRKKMCGDACQYAWSSHNDYLAITSATHCDHPLLLGLRLFAVGNDDTPEQMKNAYLAYLQWRIAKDQHDAAGIPFDAAEPIFPAGDRHFARRFCGVPMLNQRCKLDLRDRAIHHLKRIEPTATIDDLRKRYLPRAQCAIRKELIAALVQDHYSRSGIADFLRVSDSTVSAIACAMRYAVVELEQPGAKREGPSHNGRGLP